MKVTTSVWLTADKSKAVPAGHRDAAFQLVGAGGHITTETAKKYGITETGIDAKGGNPTGLPSVPHMVNANAPDGVNTAPGTPAATPAAAVALPAPQEPPKAKPPVSQPDTEGAPKPARAKKAADPLKAIAKGKAKAKTGDK